MRNDYGEAAGRHFEDAIYLESDRRLANADQLYGVSAECALKFVMVCLGAETKGTGDLNSHWFHIDKLWNEFQSWVSGRQGSELLSLLAAFEGSNPFEDWSVAQRSLPTERSSLARA